MQRESGGGSVYLRLSTRSIEQVQRQITPELAADMIAGAYWMRPPGPNCQIVLAYTGALAPEAIQAAGLMAEDRRDVGLLAITSGDRLFADHSRHGAASHIGRLLESAPRDCAIVTMADGHPAGLAWLGGVRGHRTRALGVDHFGQSGALPDLFRHFGIDVEGALAAAEEISPGRPLRYLPPTLVA
jgi:pyruvate dehydrogenase E1 component